jgi:hypothetical protein
MPTLTRVMVSPFPRQNETEVGCLMTAIRGLSGSRAALGHLVGRFLEYGENRCLSD